MRLTFEHNVEVVPHESNLSLKSKKNNREHDKTTYKCDFPFS